MTAAGQGPEVDREHCSRCASRWIDAALDRLHSENPPTEKQAALIARLDAELGALGG